MSEGAHLAHALSILVAALVIATIFYDIARHYGRERQGFRDDCPSSRESALGNLPSSDARAGERAAPVAAVRPSRSRRCECRTCRAQWPLRVFDYENERVR